MPAATASRVGPGGRYLATTGTRVVGYAADSFLLSIAMALAWQVISPALGEDGRSGLSWQWAIVALSVVVDGGYFILLWSGGRQTIGMRLFRIEVVRSRDGAGVPIAVAALRWAVLFIPGFVLGFVDLGPANDLLAYAAGIAVGWAWTIVLLASVILSPTRQGLHDRVAGTSVTTG